LTRSVPLHAIDSTAEEDLKRLAFENLNDLHRVIEWNGKKKIRVFILPYGLFPYADSPHRGYSLQFAEKELRSIGALALEGRERLIMHIPPDIAQLIVSKDESDKVRLVRSLSYATSLFKYMRLENTGVIILDLSSVGENLDAEWQTRLKENYSTLASELKQCIALSNDPFNVTAETLLNLCLEIKVPLVVNTHAHEIHSGGTDTKSILKRSFETWKNVKKRQLILFSQSALPDKEFKTASIEKKLETKDRIIKLPPLFKSIKNSDVVILSSLHEQNCGNLPRTTSVTVYGSPASCMEIYRKEYEKGIKILKELP